MAPVRLTCLPNELLSRIMDFAPGSSLPKLSLVSQRFMSIVLPKLYKSVFFGMLPPHPSAFGSPRTATLRGHLEALSAVIGHPTTVILSMSSVEAYYNKS
jgi:hypothetical protein